MPTLPTRQFPFFRRPFLQVFAVGLLFAANGSLHGQTVVYANRTSFQLAAPAATNTINFERGLAQGTGTGPLNTFTELGYVTFYNNSNYTQQIVDGYNVGQGPNDVYTSAALDKTAPTANITFDAGVLAFGLDFQNTSNGLGTGLNAESYTFNLFSVAISLGSFSAVTPQDGSTFQFIGFTSNIPITGLTIEATVPYAPPNRDIVLDNFLVASPVPEPSAMALVGLGLLGLVAAQRFFRRRTI